MAAKREDLRVVKTKRNLKAELRRLLLKKPIDKITVKELCENALVNKGTFYLHYPDIYALYEETVRDFLEESVGSLTYYREFFTAPRQFVQKFLRDFQKSDFTACFPYMDDSKERIVMPHLTDSVILEHILATGLVAPTTENKIRIHCCISTITVPLMYFGTEYLDMLCSVSGEIIANAIGEFEIQKGEL